MNDLVSIIVPVYNVASYLHRCVDSLLNQSHKNIEIILIDDGSKDDSGRICDEYRKLDGRVIVIHKKNGGLSSARNAGIDIARGAYIGFVDSDDYVEDNMYEELLKAITKYNVEIACVGAYREDEESGERVVVRTPCREMVYDSDEALIEILLSRDIGISVWSKLYRASIFRNVRFPEGENNEDAAVLLETMCENRVVHIGKPMYHYMIRDTSITSKYNQKTLWHTYEHSETIMNSIPINKQQLLKVATFYRDNMLYNIVAAYLSQDEIIDPRYVFYFGEFKKIWLRLIRSGYCEMRKILLIILIRIRIYKKIRKIYQTLRKVKEWEKK